MPVVRSIKNISIGDTVIIEKASNASLNLWMKARQQGMMYIKCPCNAKKGNVFEVKAKFENGYILKGTNNTLQIVAYSSDMRKVNV